MENETERRIPCRGLLSPFQTICVTFNTSTKAFLKFFKLFSSRWRWFLHQRCLYLYHKGNERQIIIIVLVWVLYQFSISHTNFQFFFISIVSLTTAWGIIKNQINTFPENYKEQLIYFTSTPPPPSTILRKFPQYI